MNPNESNPSSATIGGAILCAGFGSRMAPLTDALPKPLLPFLNVPTIAYPMAQMMRAGIGSIAFNTHHLADAIPPVAQRLAKTFAIKPFFVHEEELLGSGGGIKGVVDALGDACDHVVIMNGDTVLEIDLGPHIEAHIDSGSDVSLVLRPKVDTQPGRVFLDGSGNITRIRDYKAPSYQLTHEEYDFLGIHIIKKGVLDAIALKKCDIIDSLYGPMVIEKRKLRASLHEGYFVALDTPDLMLAESVRAMNEPGLFGDAPFPDPLRPGLYVYRPGTIANAATVTPPVFIGANVSVGPGAHLGPNVVLDGVDVIGGTRIENAILYGAGKIEGEWKNCISIAGKTVVVRPQT